MISHSKPESHIAHPLLLRTPTNRQAIDNHIESDRSVRRNLQSDGPDGFESPWLGENSGGGGYHKNIEITGTASMSTSLRLCDVREIVQSSYTASVSNLMTLTTGSAMVLLCLCTFLVNAFQTSHD